MNRAGVDEKSNIEKLNKLSSDFEAKEVYGSKAHDNLANMVNVGMKASFFHYSYEGFTEQISSAKKL